MKGRSIELVNCSRLWWAGSLESSSGEIFIQENSAANWWHSVRIAEAFLSETEDCALQPLSCLRRRVMKLRFFLKTFLPSFLPSSLTQSLHIILIRLVTSWTPLGFWCISASRWSLDFWFPKPNHFSVLTWCCAHCKIYILYIYIHMIGMPGKGALKDGQLLHVLGSTTTHRWHLQEFLNHSGVDVWWLELNYPQVEDEHPTQLEAVRDSLDAFLMLQDFGLQKVIPFCHCVRLCWLQALHLQRPVWYDWLGSSCVWVHETGSCNHTATSAELNVKVE